MQPSTLSGPLEDFVHLLPKTRAYHIRQHKPKLKRFFFFRPQSRNKLDPVLTLNLAFESRSRLLCLWFFRSHFLHSNCDSRADVDSVFPRQGWGHGFSRVLNLMRSGHDGHVLQPSQWVRAQTQPKDRNRTPLCLYMETIDKHTCTLIPVTHTHSCTTHTSAHSLHTINTHCHTWCPL